MKANEGTMASRLKDFVRMNPPIFLGSKVRYDPLEFVDEVYKCCRSNSEGEGGVDFLSIERCNPNFIYP